MAASTADEKFLTLLLSTGTLVLKYVPTYDLTRTLHYEYNKGARHFCVANTKLLSAECISSC